MEDGCYGRCIRPPPYRLRDDLEWQGFRQRIELGERRLFLFIYSVNWPSSCFPFACAAKDVRTISCVVKPERGGKRESDMRWDCDAQLQWWIAAVL